MTRSETNAIITSHAGEDYALRPGSCGLPSPVNDFQIMNMETGAILKAGEIGEICCRGPNIAEGYWQNPKATAESFSKDGWFKTGDVGYISEEGWVYILDRAKEIIIRGGENISTITVENAIVRCFFFAPIHHVLHYKC
jgi:acyl-CoA synthetase (AMP-forming)/AMP-acid ligase II